MKHIQVTERDREIFRYVGQRGLATTQTIHQTFWDGRTLQTAQDRLTQLTKGGYLRTATTDARGRAEQIYWLSRKATQLFSAAERASFVKGNPTQAEIGHVLTTSEVIEKLKGKYQVSHFVHERALKGELKRGASTVLADARAELDGIDYLIEIDSPHYTGQRLRRKGAGFGKAGKPTLWVVGGQARLHTVSQSVAGYANIQVVLLGEL